VAQAVEWLPSKCEALNSNPNATKKKKKKKEKKKKARVTLSVTEWMKIKCIARRGKKAKHQGYNCVIPFLECSRKCKKTKQKQKQKTKTK
jgi:hypothetical protein